MIQKVCATIDFDSPNSDVAFWLSRPVTERLEGLVNNQDFKELLALLDTSGARYLIIGGYAVALHGHPRYTKDIDFWIDGEMQNAEKVVAALSAFGFGSLGLTASDFAEDKIVMLGVPPNRIDFISHPKGVEFESCYAARMRVELGSLIIDFIGREDLIANKKATGRPQDIADVVALS